MTIKDLVYQWVAIIPIGCVLVFLVYAWVEIKAYFTERQTEYLDPIERKVKQLYDREALILEPEWGSADNGFACMQIYGQRKLDCGCADSWNLWCLVEEHLIKALLEDTDKEKVEVVKRLILRFCEDFDTKPALVTYGGLLYVIDSSVPYTGSVYMPALRA